MWADATGLFSNALYMLVIVDDFSRFTWVSFLKLKSEVFSFITTWKKMVELEADMLLKSIRADRGGELVSLEFTQCCASMGI